MKKYILSLIIILISQIAFSQIKGKVTDKETKEGIPGVFIRDISGAHGTVSTPDGNFEIKTSENIKTLLFSMPGYNTDTVSITENQNIAVQLQKNTEIEGVIVNSNLGASFISETTIDYRNTITADGLTKLPCCNLSESFENTASVDVTFSDAVSGTKQIKMLGLAGVYSQILRENIPAAHGLFANYGLSHFPGPWLESVQLSKGSATVKNGYESITGQINLEYKKPENTDKLFINLFSNSEGRYESNITASHIFNENLSTMILFHGSKTNKIIDANNDNFADGPLGYQINFMNRWKTESKNKRMEAQFGISFIEDKKIGGQIEYINSENKAGNAYGINLNSRRAEAFGKIGFLMPGEENGSVGTIFSFSRGEYNSKFGNKTYNATQNSFYSNIIYENDFFNEKNYFKAGASFVYDDYKEFFIDTEFPLIENVPGIFAEYSYTNLEKLSLSAGLRADFHNLYGTMLSPRVHFKYKIFDNLTMRTSAGKGYRTAHIFAENNSIFASSRIVNIIENPVQEEAWNYGINFVFNYAIDTKRKITYSIDFFRTDFLNQVIIDLDADAHYVNIYNLKGKSYANSLHSELTLNPIERFDITAAIRYDDVKVTLHNELKDKPFVNNYKGLLTMSYTTRLRKWSFDLTNQFVGKAPLPDLSANAAAADFVSQAPAYYILHAQITRRFKYNLEIYAGGENLTNFTQKQSVINPENPFGDNFDASIIWGPLMGRTLYAGLRFTIK